MKYRETLSPSRIIMYAAVCMGFIFWIVNTIQQSSGIAAILPHSFQEKTSIMFMIAFLTIMISWIFIYIRAIFFRPTLLDQIDYGFLIFLLIIVPVCILYLCTSNSIKTQILGSVFILVCVKDIISYFRHFQKKEKISFR